MFDPEELHSQFRHMYGDRLKMFDVNVKHEYQTISPHNVYPYVVYQIKLVVRFFELEDFDMLKDHVKMSFGKFSPVETGTTCAIEDTYRHRSIVVSSTYVVVDSQIDKFCIEVSKAAIEFRDKDFYKALDEVLSNKASY